jgi:hypothetical protein
LSLDLRAGPRRLAGREIVENLRQDLRRQVLVIVLVDLQHGRIHAGAQAFHLDPGEGAVRADVMLLPDFLPQRLLQILGAAQHAGRRAAQLDVIASDRFQIEHGVEGRDFERPDMRHAEKIRHVTNGGLGQPAAGLRLRAPQQGEDRGFLAAMRIFGQLGLGPFQVLRGEREALGLDLDRSEATRGHHAISKMDTSLPERLIDLLLRTRYRSSR